MPRILRPFAYANSHVPPAGPTPIHECHLARSRRMRAGGEIAGESLPCLSLQHRLSNQEGTSKHRSDNAATSPTALDIEFTMNPSSSGLGPFPALSPSSW